MEHELSATMDSPARQRALAKNRIRFLTAEAPDPRWVRRPILASWQRSASLHVPADRVQIPYAPDFPDDTLLIRSAAPVLRNLREQLEGQALSVVLTDPHGLVLRRLTGDGTLERHLDKVLLAPGFNYGEQFVGTNGIGTALEVGGPAHVFGHEHYAEDLDDLACAGVPLHHPITGRLVGALDLTCWRKDAGVLLLTLAKSTATQIAHALLEQAGASQLSFFQEYIRIGNGRPGLVLGVSRDLVLLNDEARGALDPVDQATLLAHVTEVLTTGGPTSLVVDLASGDQARLSCHVIGDGGRTEGRGVVAQGRLESGSDSARRLHRHSPWVPLPGLVGSGSSWLHACEEAERAFLAGDWVVVEGEPGVGKTAILRALSLRRQPVSRFVVLDASDAAADNAWMNRIRRAASDGAVVLIVQHVDHLSPPALRTLASVLQEARSVDGSLLWVAVTMDHGGGGAELDELFRSFPRTLEVPPLRLHLEDLRHLIPFFLARLGPGSSVVCSPAAIRLLMRMPWPGNVEQLHRLLRDVVKRRRSGIIEPDDLPPEAHTRTKRLLTPLESLERDAIVRALSDSGGDKARAANFLGMSRATIYRKIHDFGIV